MRQRMCNGCKHWSAVDQWDFGCPSCGHGNGREVSYSEYPGVEVMPDIAPYQSMADGSIISSRSTHRQHLKRHNAIEIGNDTAQLLRPRAIPDAAPQQRKELIVAQFQALGHEGFKRALKRDIDFVKWNSRKD